jgi:hypothetical protein
VILVLQFERYDFSPTSTRPVCSNLRRGLGYSSAFDGMLIPNLVSGVIDDRSNKDGDAHNTCNKDRKGDRHHHVARPPHTLQDRRDDHATELSAGSRSRQAVGMSAFCADGWAFAQAKR